MVDLLKSALERMAPAASQPPPTAVPVATEVEGSVELPLRKIIIHFHARVRFIKLAKHKQ